MDKIPQRQDRAGKSPSTKTSGRQFQVASHCELLPYLESLPLGLSHKQAKDLIRLGAVITSGRPRHLRHDTRLAPGDIVTIARGRQLRDDGGLERHGLKIVHLDEAIVVIDKPAGLLSMGSMAEKQRTAYRILNDHLKSLAKSERQQIFIVHRLDRETSGLMMFARTEAIQNALQQNWRSVTKRYRAVVEGTPDNPEATLRDQLAENKALRVHQAARDGNEAVTHYRLLSSNQQCSLLELTLETGRKNQIRVQLAAIGHPIVGDHKYGAASDPVRRLALHACELKFPHPVTGAAMEFHSALPGRLRTLLEPLRQD